MFHRVLPSEETCYEPELATSVPTFEGVLDWLSSDFEIVPVQDVAHPNMKRKNASKPVCSITFDDGWRDNYLYAFPILRARRIPATIFLPVKFIGTDRHFWQELLWFCDQRLETEGTRSEVVRRVARKFPWFPTPDGMVHSYRNLKRFLMMRPTEEAEEFTNALTEAAGLASASPNRAFINWNEAQEMCDSGIEFGSHTLNHVLLTQMEPARAAAEIRDSRRYLQEGLGRDVAGFSYPWGAAGPITRQIVEDAGYRYAVATHPGGLAEGADDRWWLPRIAISDSVVGNRGSFNPDTAIVSSLASVLAAWRPKRLIRRAISKPKKRIKIAFVLDQISEWEGGTERQLRTLIQTLDPTYFEPELFFVFGTPELPTESLPCATRWICPNARHQGSFTSRLFRLIRELRNFDPDIVQTFFIEGIVAGTIAARLARVPAVVVSWRNSGHWIKNRHRIALRTAAALAHQWQPNSRIGCDQVKRTYGVPASRVELLPNAIDLRQFAPPSEVVRCVARQRLGIRGEVPVFVSIAALTPVKDFRTLIKAVKRSKSELSGAQFLIVGDGELKRELEDYSEQLGLGDTIRFVGRQPDVRPYLAAADFGVLTSKSEGSSNSVLEYMAVGLPSVLSDIPSNRELASGLFFEPGHDSDLAAKIVAITEDSALRHLLKREYLATVRQYGLEKFALRIQSYYSRLANASSIAPHWLVQ